MAHRRLAWTLFGSLMIACGCSPPRSRLFAITLQDATEIECEGVSLSPTFEQADVDQLARDLEGAMEAQRKADPPTPEGRMLRVNEIEDRMRAWFDPYTTVADFNAPRQYATPTTVYEGEPHDDYIEGWYEDRFNTDQQDAVNERQLCGERLRASGLLTVTDEDGVMGRIRWTDVLWLEAGISACGGQVSCVRNLEIEGLEVE